MELYETLALRAKILIVDDEELCGRMLMRLLEGAGYTKCTYLSDPQEAVELFEHFNPDLVLLDMHMEPLSGIEVLERINSSRPERVRPQVLVMTGDTSAEAKHGALAAGATDFLAKPLDEIEVLLRIRNLLHARSLYQRCQLYSHGLERLVEKRTQALQQNTRSLESTIAELRDTQHQLVQQERVRALGTMACGLAHDLNNGLTLILGYGDILLNDSSQNPPGSQSRRCLEAVVQAGLDNAQLVRRLRDFYRPNDELANPQPMDLNSLVQQAITMTMPRWQAQTQALGIVVEVKSATGDLPILQGAPAEIREVLTNLIFNAVDAMPGGGLVTISTEVDGPCVVLSVADSGDGMDEETRLHCFEPFFTTKGQGGSGLGLAVSQAIVRRHGGSLSVESELQVGTTFTIRLPIPTSPVLADLEIVEAPSPALSILIVDDNEAICEILASYLKEDGHAVDSAQSGTEALAKLRESVYSLVITDLAMPSMSGDELAAKIKAATPEQPIIMLTGFSEVVGGAGGHADCLLKKPARLVDLRGAIKRVLSTTRETEPRPMTPELPAEEESFAKVGTLA